MARVPGCEAVYEVAEQWRDRCLVQDKSLLWPDLEEPTWTVENLERAEVQIDLARQGDRAGWRRLIEVLEEESNSIVRLITDLVGIWALLSWVPASTKLEWVKHLQDLPYKKEAPLRTPQAWQQPLEKSSVPG
jgi:hypothetical protein